MHVGVCFDALAAVFVRRSPPLHRYVAVSWIEKFVMRVISAVATPLTTLAFLRGTELVCRLAFIEDLIAAAGAPFKTGGCCI